MNKDIYLSLMGINDLFKDEVVSSIWENNTIKLWISRTVSVEKSITILHELVVKGKDLAFATASLKDLVYGNSPELKIFLKENTEIQEPVVDQPQKQTPRKPISRAQQNKIFAESGKLGLTKDYIREYSKFKFNKGISELSSQEASKLIDDIELKSVLCFNTSSLQSKSH